jgi:hypothetical protein
VTILGGLQVDATTFWRTDGPWQDGAGNVEHGPVTAPSGSSPPCSTPRGGTGRAEMRCR